MITEKQKLARRRNWLILRLEGARSVFSHDNIVLMEDLIKENSLSIRECEEAIDELLYLLRKCTKNRNNNVR